MLSWLGIHDRYNTPLVKKQNNYCHKTHYQHKDALQKNADLLLLEYVCVFAQTKFAEQLRQIRSLEEAVQVTAIASSQWGNAVHVITATEIVFSWKERKSNFQSCHGSAQFSVTRIAFDYPFDSQLKLILLNNRMERKRQNTPLSGLKEQTDWSDFSC